MRACSASTPEAGRYVEQLLGLLDGLVDMGNSPRAAVLTAAGSVIEGTPADPVARRSMSICEHLAEYVGA